MIQKQKFPVNLVSGVDTKTSDKLTTGLLELENAVFTKTGEVTKRNGFTTLGSALTNPKKVFSREGTLYGIGDDSGVSQILQYNDREDYFEAKATLSAGTQSSRITPTTFDSGILSNSGSGTLAGDQCLAGNYIFYCWAQRSPGSTTSVDYRFALQDKTSKEFTTRTGIISNAAAIGQAEARIRCAETTNNIVVIYTIGNNSTNISSISKTNIHLLDTFSGNTVGGAARFLSDSSTSAEDKLFDLVVDGTDVYWYYKANSGDTLTLESFDEDISSQDSITFDTGSLFALSTNKVDVSGDTKIVCTWADHTSGALDVAVFDASDPTNLVSDYNTTFGGSTGTGVYNTEIIEDPASNGTAIIYADTPTTSTFIPGTEVKDFSIDGSSGTTSSSTSYPVEAENACGMATRPFTDGTDIYIGLSDSGDSSQTTRIQKVSDNVDQLATFGIGEISNYGRNDNTFMPNVVTINPTEYAFLLFEESTTSITELGAGDKLRWARVDIGSSTSPPIEVDKGVFFPQGAPVYFDGEFASQAGFPVTPKIDDVLDNTSGSGTVANGTYLVYVALEWTDTNGTVHRSSPSNAFSHTKVGGDSLDVRYIMDSSNVKPGAVAKIYVTEAGGNIPYLQIIGRDTSFRDIVMSIETDTEILYTTSDELAAVAAPACRQATVWNNRVWLAGTENPDRIWYSKLINGVYAPEFNESFVQDIYDGTGGVKAVKGMDSNLVIFKENDLFYLNGDGPNDLGEGIFSDPQGIASDVGISEVRSLVEFPNGLLFKSNKGIYQLSRSLQVEYIGAPVEDFNGETIVSANLIEDKNEVRFATSSGNMLVYNYYFNQWSVFTGKDALSATLWRGGYAYLDASDSKVKTESNSTYLDDTDFVQMKIKTGWIKLAGVQGFQRVQRIQFLGDYHTPHNFSLTVYNDYDTTSVDSKVFDATTNASNVYQHEYHVKRQKCNAIQLEIVDTDTDQTVGTGQSYTLTNVTFQLGVKQGLNKLNTARTY